MTRFLAILLLPAVAAAQREPVITLKPANASLAEEYSKIKSVRELADGRVLIGDERERRLVVADLRSGMVSVIARVGRGPGEFQSVGPFVALPRDSTLMPDWGSQRWLLLADARVVATVPPETPAIKIARVMALGADGHGRVLSWKFALATGGRPFAPADSLFLIRVERATGRADTIGRLRSLYERGKLFGGGREVAVPPMAVGDQALLFADGWVAIARLDPYRVDWRAADGRIARGAPLPFSATKVDEREKRAYLDRLTKKWGQAPQYADDVWPADLPPFESDALLPAPDGKLLIRRVPTASQPNPRYDLVDRRGALTGQITLPEGQHIVGFGAKSVYVAVTDDDGIQRLRRHPWP